MYLPPHFVENRTDALHALMRAFPLATLVIAGNDGDGPDANHLPLLLAEEGGQTVLHGHVARGNPLAKADGAAALAIFHGPDAYVSPTWYPGKAANPRMVPTWNYAVVHARGTLRTFADTAWLRRHLDALTAMHEAAAGSDWKVDDAPADYRDRMLGAIVGIELVVAGIEGKFKMSQNRSEQDRQGVIAGLRASGDPKALQLAAWMSGDDTR